MLIDDDIDEMLVLISNYDENLNSVNNNVMPVFLLFIVKVYILNI